MGLTPVAYFRIFLVAASVAFWVWRRLRKPKSPNPDSLIIRFRAKLAKKIQPHPEPGYAWCIDCSVNGGRTTAFRAEWIDNHVRTYHGGKEYVEIDVRWQPIQMETYR